MTGTVTQTQASDKAIEFHLNDMKAIFDKEDLSVNEKLMEATHYGMRRLYERSTGPGHRWLFTFTATLLKDGNEGISIPFTVPCRWTNHKTLLWRLQP